MFDELRGNQWRMTDALSGDVYDRHGNELLSPGLYVDLQPWKYHFLRLNKIQN
jgi:hypothetical protein